MTTTSVILDVKEYINERKRQRYLVLRTTSENLKRLFYPDYFLSNLVVFEFYFKMAATAVVFGLELAAN